jgi:hypothetical protein
MNRTLMKNVRRLGNYLHRGSKGVTEADREGFISLVQNNPGITLDDLLHPDSLRAIGADADHIYTLIGENEVIVDLTTPLTEPSQVHVYPHYTLSYDTRRKYIAGLR